MPTTTTQIFDEIEQQIITLASNTTSKYKAQAIADANALIAEIKDDLVRWVALLNDKKITTAEFEFLLNSEKSVAKMSALEDAGLAVIRVQQFEFSVLNMVADVVLKATVGLV